MLRKKLKLQKVDATNNGQNKEIATTAALSSSPSTDSFWKRFYDIECRMNEQFRSINFVRGPVAAVYNPVEYAAELHCAYLEKYLTGPKTVLFIGMNPGPWGMVQTGVISIARYIGRFSPLLRRCLFILLGVTCWTGHTYITIIYR